MKGRSITRLPESLVTLHLVWQTRLPIVIWQVAATIHHLENTLAVHQISTGQRNVSKSGLQRTHFQKNGSPLSNTWTYMVRISSILEGVAGNVISGSSPRSFCRK
jgi:hypothetical protein